MLPPSYSKLPTRFWDKVTPDENGCWLWTGSTNDKGYGYFRRPNGMKSVHRLSARDYEGVIPEGLHTLHKCDTRPCVNPPHLYFGTNQDNVDDKMRRGRAFTRGVKGEENINAILTEQDVKDIRSLYAGGGHTHLSLSKIYAVSDSAVRHVVIRKTWAHVA